MAFYKDHYDAIVIGGALSGMACALTLAKKGKSVLILERHNLPGGIATSFVRGGVEMEATLHEMMSIGPEEQPLKIRVFFDEMGVKINWLRVPEAYRISVPFREDRYHPSRRHRDDGERNRCPSIRAPTRSQTPDGSLRDGLRLGQRFVGPSDEQADDATQAQRFRPDLRLFGQRSHGQIQPSERSEGHPLRLLDLRRQQDLRSAVYGLCRPDGRLL
jgi:phytoene dehydrogenase-like protein